MKQASLVRLFSWLVVMALAATLMPPAVSSNAYVTQREATASAPEALLAASAADAPLSSSVALDVAPVRASQVISDSAGLAATPSLTATMPMTVAMPLTATVPSTVAAPPDEQTRWGEEVRPPVLTMTADPFQVAPGGVITYSVAITNVDDAALLGVVLSDTLPAGVVYVAESAVGFSYSPRDQRLSWAIEQMEPGQGLRGGFQLQATELGIGQLITNTVSASSANAPVVTASAVVEVAPPRQNRVWATPGEGGWLRSEDGRVDLRAPVGAMPRRTELRYTAQASQGLPEHIFYAFDLTASDEASQPVTQFERPLTLSAFFNPRQLPPDRLERLTLFHLNQDSGEWEVVPSQVDPRWRRVVAQIDRLAMPSQQIAEGAAGESSQQAVSDDGSDTYALGESADVAPEFITERMSSLRGAQTNLFSLSIGYSYRFDLPPGQGGLTPLLGLNYSSANHTPASGHHSVAGFGWELAGADYVYIPPGDPNLNKITLSLQGRTYSLREGANSKWYAVEDPLMKVEPGSWSHGTAGSWTVWTQDGTKYSFFAEPDNAAVYYWKLCGSGDPGERYVRIPLREIEDKSGNKVHFTWATEHETNGAYGCEAYKRAVRLEAIQYNSDKVRVQLIYEDRQDRANRFDQPIWRFYTEMRLAKVIVQARADGTGAWRTVREYRLSHDVGTGDPNHRSNLVLNLETIEERDAAGNTLPSTSIWYSDRFFTADTEFGAMTKISNGYGGEIVFVSDHRGGNGNNAHIVSARTEKYGVADLVDQTWSYTGVNWDGSGGNELAKGYKEVRVTRPDGAVEKHFFHGIETVNGQASDHLAGREWRFSVTSDGVEMKRVDTTWVASTDYLPVLPAQDAVERIKPRHVRAAYSETFEAGKQLVRTEYSYDPNKQGGTQWGNVTRTLEKVWTSGAWSNPYRASYVWYVPNVAQSITNKPARIELYDGCADCSGVSPGSIVSQRLLYYDQDTAGNWQQAPTLGRLRFETIGSGVPGSTPLSSTEYQYWSNGNLRKVIDGLQRASETFYDSQFHAYPVCVKNALGHTVKTRYYGVPGSTNSGCVTDDGSPAWNGAQQAANAFFGQTEDITDANNALTSFDYDTWGRVLRVWRPGESKGVTDHAATEVFTYQNSGPFKVKHSRRDDLGGTNAATYLESYTFYDTFGRAVQTQSEAASAGQIIVANTRTNGLDQVVRQSLPYEVVATLGDYQTPDWDQPKTETSYDGLGRVLTVINPNGSQRQTRYRFDATMANREIGVVDELGHQQIQEIDAFGRLVKAKQYTVTVTGSPPVPNWSATVYAAASYEYDVADRLKRMVGPDNAETIISYDALGRKTSMSDPNMGAWLYRYDAAGNLRKQRDAKDVLTCFHYDSLNRLVGKTFHPNTPDPASVNCSTQPTPYPVAYSYDFGPNGKGRRTGMVDLSGSTAWEYDVRGRMTKETKVISGAGGGAFVTQWNSYDAMDRVRSMTYPDGEGVTFSYTAQGPIKTVYGSSTYYVGETLYNALGQVTDRYLGSTAGLIRQKYTYTQAENFRLTALQSGVASAYTNLQNLSYSYDAVGNVKSIVDVVNSNQRQCYNYDALHRLTRGFTTDSATCASANLTIGSGPFDETTTYQDALGGRGGNLTSKDGLTYTYNTIKPHAVRTGWGSGDNPRQVMIRAKGVSYAGVWPQMTLRVNGTDRQTWTVNSTDYHTYIANGVSLTGNDVIEVVYSNDVGARDLYVQYVKMDEIEWWAGEMIYDKGSGAAAFDGLDVILGQEAMHWNGALRFVGGVGAFAAGYDANGNMTHRVRYGEGAIEFTYDAENRLTQANQMGLAQATFVYDGDGNRVKATFGSTTTVYVGNIYERDNGSTVRKYYYAGGVRVTMRTGGQTYYLLSDHLGGTNVTANSGGVQLSKLLYKPWGETRFSTGTTPTTWRFTGQREDATIGLYFYNARFYDPQLGRFTSADSVVQSNPRDSGVVLSLTVSYANPRMLAQMNDFQRSAGQAVAAYDPQLLNRYAYARNNPLAYRDDSGHVVWWVVGGIVGGVVGLGAYALTHQDNFNWKDAALWTGGGAVVGATFGAGAQFVAGTLGTQAAVAAGTSAATTTVAASRGLNAFSRAGEFGIQSYNQLRTMISGTGLQAHHLIEQRFAKGLGLNAGKMPSIALTRQEHQAFTNLWRSAIGYNTDPSMVRTTNATLQDIWIAAQQVYAQHPELLEVVRQTLFGQ